MRTAAVLSMVLLHSSKVAILAGEPQLELVVQTGHTDRVLCTAVSADGKYVVSASSDVTAILWNATIGKRIHIFQGHTSRWITSVAVSGDGKYAVTGSVDKTAILWETASGKKLQTLQ